MYFVIDYGKVKCYINLYKMSYVLQLVYIL